MVHVSDNVVKAVHNINIWNIQKDTLETHFVFSKHIWPKKLPFFFPQKRLYLYITRLDLDIKIKFN